jgi:hypothetical protein
MDLTETDLIARLDRGIETLQGSMRGFSSRLKAFELAVQKGDPRFCKPQFAREDFNQSKFDRWCRARKIDIDGALAWL